MRCTVGQKCIGAILITAATALTGCGPLISNKGPAQKFYVLDSKPQCDTVPVRKKVKVLINSTDGSTFLSNQRIIFGPDSITRSSYQFAFWTEPPTARISRLIEESLRCSSLAAEVSTAPGLIDPDLTLSTRLEEFYHDATSQPGQGVVSLRAELYNERNRAIVATTVFHATAPAPTFDAVGAVTALSRATEDVLLQLMQWLSSRSRE